jgi:hypothetical protein
MTDEPSPVDRTLLSGAALASAAAGLIHAAAAGSHAGDRTLVLLFAGCAAAQAGWAGLVALRPTRLVAVVGVVVNAAALAAWIGSRTTGLLLIDSLREAEDVGLQDLVDASFALVAVLGALLALAQPRWLRLRLSPLWSVFAVALVGLLAVPAMAAEHSHDDASHNHDHSHDGEDNASAVADHEHHDVPDRLDHEPTAEQETAAQELIDETKQATAGYADVQAAIDAGYRSIGDGANGFEHFVNAGFTANATMLDPAEPESLVYRVGPDGSRELTTVMYILPPASTMDDVPDIAGNLTVWHVHDNLCFAPGSTRLAGAVVGGQCRPAGVQRTTSPMLHVWVLPNDCGPFAGTDRRQATGSCVGEP